jgi:H+-transporting ATPase
MHSSEEHGLTSQAAEAYQRAHGYNEITERRESLLHKILKRSMSPISGMILLAAALSYGSGKLFDGSFILALFVLNIAVTVWQEHKADRSLEELNQHLAALVKVFRDGVSRVVPARELVPDDIIQLFSGNEVPADLVILDATSASANEAALTGESLPKDKQKGDLLYSGSFLASGFVTAKVTAIGNHTSFGATLAKANIKPKRSALERDILRITKFLSFLSLIAVAILTVFLFHTHAPLIDVIRLDLSLIIAGIPISLPTVMTLMIALGVVELSKKNAVVRRLSSLEELANTDLLLTDKTGTLTKNHIAVNDIVGYAMDVEEIKRLGACIGSQEPDEVLNKALTSAANPLSPQVHKFIPADSIRKHSTLVFEDDGSVRTLSLGAPQVIEKLCDLTPDLRDRFGSDVHEFAARGYRTLALSAVNGEDEAHMQLLGIFALSDELHEDAKDIIAFLDENGIEVSMVTGDNRAIAEEVAEALEMPGTQILTHDQLKAQGIETLSAETFRDTRSFAEILPEDKLALVERARTFYTVASNGDGINDLPAVKAANIGFAVSNAVDALKATADIVLLSPGIGVMRDAFIEGRKIFARLYTYSLYRISESFRLIVTIVILGLMTGTYPLSPLQLILLALLNDIPIIALGTDRVKIASRPAHIHVRAQFTQSLLYGVVGLLNSLILFAVATWYLHLPLPVVETLFFLKLTVSGHLLIYVAHTKERWWRYLPSRPVILATSLTQAVATLLAITGWLMPAAITWQMALFVWFWSFLFMQAGELVKLKHSPTTARNMKGVETRSSP